MSLKLRTSRRILQERRLQKSTLTKSSTSLAKKDAAKDSWMVKRKATLMDLMKGSEKEEVLALKMAGAKNKRNTKSINSKKLLRLTSLKPLKFYLHSLLSM